MKSQECTKKRQISNRKMHSRPSTYAPAWVSISSNNLNASANNATASRSEPVISCDGLVVERTYENSLRPVATDSLVTLLDYRRRALRPNFMRFPSEHRKQKAAGGICSAHTSHWRTNTQVSRAQPEEPTLLFSPRRNSPARAH